MKSTVIDNQTLVREEQLGYASQYYVRHETHILDPEVREKLLRCLLVKLLVKTTSNI